MTIPWESIANDVAGMRRDVGDAGILAALGVVDEDALRCWIQATASDTLATFLGVDPNGGSYEVGAERVAAALCAHLQVGIEIGLWCAQRGIITKPESFRP